MHSDSTPQYRSCDCDAHWSDLCPPYVLNVLMLVHVHGYGMDWKFSRFHGTVAVHRKQLYSSDKDVGYMYAQGQQ